ncbi:M16 family metallopeptidase [Alteromonas sp. CYL-A6]|uniref:M16 family metallopeptidase n=1 Tax=Alteromonas nitratireducens TaxID=3390813 RepID=UPI0034BCF156
MKAFRLLPLTGLLWLSASSLNSVAADFPSTPPPPAAPKNFTLPATSDFTLDNGLSVTLIPYGDTPKVTMVLQFDSGNQDDGDATGISDLTFELLKQGTATRDAAALATLASSMGGQLQTSVGMNSSQVGMDVLTEFSGDAVSLIADVVMHSVFPEDSLNRAVANRWREVQVSQSRAQGQALEAFYAAMYPNHPYGTVFPTEAQLTGITTDDLKAFAAQHLVAANAHLYVAGNFDEAALTSAIKAAFAAMPAGKANPGVSGEPATPSAGLVRISRDNAVQTTLRLGQRVVPLSHKDAIALEVTNTLLGGMFSSRITQNIREDKGYTYSPRSAVSSYRDASVWYESADIDAPSTGEALNEIIKEIRGLQTTPPPKTELDGVKKYASGIFVLRNSSRSGLIGQLVNLDVNRLPRRRLTDYISEVNGLTEARISAMASQYLNLDSMSLIIVGDDELLDRELAEVEQLPVLSENGN